MNEEYLTQRLEDLNGRLEELTDRLPESCMDERYDRLVCARLTDETVDAVIPAHLFTVEDVLTAIGRVKTRLDEIRRGKRTDERRAAGGTIIGQLVFAGFADAERKLAS